MEKISFIIPSRNNLEFLKQAYNSIRNNVGKEHEVVMLDDSSDDGTWDWLSSLKDPNILIYKNWGPERLGHTILYDVGVELATNEIFSILHADMVVSHNYVENILKHLKKGKVIAATRIEPPLHPPGPEKVIYNCGMTIDEFNQEAFLNFAKSLESENKDKTTEGIFAPWCMYKSDFQAIGGHDPLFAPMELEDSDIFNRMHLAGYELIQSRDAFVYHMTCRGSRFKDGIEIEKVVDLPDGTKWYKPKDSEEYTNLRGIKFREWWRKWGQNVLHTDLLMPIVKSKYNIGGVIKNCSPQLLELLEPWFSHVYVDCETEDYIKSESLRTQYNLNKRVYSIHSDVINDIEIRIDGQRFSENDYLYIQNISDIVEGSIVNEDDFGDEFIVGNLTIVINRLKKYEKELIKSGG